MTKKMKTPLIFLLSFELLMLPAFCLIEDDFVDNSLDKNLKIKTYKTKIIEDDFSENSTRKNAITKKQIDLNEQIPSVSEVKDHVKKIAVINEEDFIPVNIKVINVFSDKQAVDEGDIIDFETVTDVKFNDKFYPKGTVVKARVETISKNAANGIPSDLTIGNFTLDNNILYGEINKTGANRSLWLYPLVCAGDIFFGAGTLFMFIRGGRTKITPKEVFTVYIKRNTEQ